MADIIDLAGKKIGSTVTKAPDEPDYLKYVIEDKTGRVHQVEGFLGLTPSFIAVAQGGSVVFALPMENFGMAYVVESYDDEVVN